MIRKRLMLKNFGLDEGRFNVGGGKRLSYAEEVMQRIAEKEPLSVTNPYVTEENLIRAVETSTAIEGVYIKLDRKKLSKTKKGK